jgi:secreted trypsin-like serine protease
MISLLLVAFFGAALASQDCGVPEIPPNVDITKIVGGEFARPHSWPWQVALYAKVGIFQHICGGSLISPDYVLTAAHCVFGNDKNPSMFKVKLGAHYKGLTVAVSPFEKAMQQVIDADSVYIHPKNSPETNTFDFALLKLKQPAQVTKFVSPVCVPGVNATIEPNTKSVVTGWGTLKEGAPKTPYVLRQVIVPTITNEECQKAYGDASIDESMFCAGFAEGGKDSCQGDSGGPLVQLVEGKWTLAGVVSWGQGCAEAGYPGVYGRVTTAFDWIQEKTVN